MTKRPLNFFACATVLIALSIAVTSASNYNHSSLEEVETEVFLHSVAYLSAQDFFNKYYFYPPPDNTQTPYNAVGVVNGNVRIPINIKIEDQYGHYPFGILDALDLSSELKSCNWASSPALNMDFRYAINEYDLLFVTNGPDGDIDIELKDIKPMLRTNGDSSFSTANPHILPSLATNNIYDPTNGTFSDGDMVTIISHTIRSPWIYTYYREPLFDPESYKVHRTCLGNLIQKINANPGKN